MGCDIHSKVEVKENGQWKLNTDLVFKDPYEWRNKENGGMIPHPADGRNYDWFAILADVRNGVGFAGINTGDGFIPISEPRGVPEDATEDWKTFVEEWGCNLHSISYFSVSDFDNYDWNRKTTKTGVISLDQYKELSKTKKCPDSWSGSVGGGNNITVPQNDADRILAGETVKITDKPSIFEPEKTHRVSLESNHIINVQYYWEVDYKDWFKKKIEEYVEPMRTLKRRYDDVRIVFGFDN